MKTKRLNNNAMPSADAQVERELVTIVLAECSVSVPEAEARELAQVLAVAILKDVRHVMARAAEDCELRVFDEPTPDEMRDAILEEAIAG
jgi:hypothetical protein